MVQLVLCRWELNSVETREVNYLNRFISEFIHEQLIWLIVYKRTNVILYTREILDQF